MIRIIGMATAVVLVLLQLAGIVALRDEPAIYLTPAADTTHDHRA